MSHWVPGNIVLENGQIFSGQMPAWQKDIYFGELVFTTGMLGYVESLTDPSFAGQILMFTYPLIGNYGVPDTSFFESAKISVRGVIIAEAIEHFSHHQAQHSLLNWLEKEKIPVLCGVDTRFLTKTLRTQGVVKAAILPTNTPLPTKFPDPNAEHLVKLVSRSKKNIFNNGKRKIIAVDCGMKENILRHLKKFPVEIHVVPFDYDFSQEDFDGLFLSNGPGDPERCIETIQHLQKILVKQKPIFGICLGAQLLALAIGAKTYKLQFGHRGLNQPCINLITQKAFLTSQNHGYAIDEKTLPNDWQVTFRHLNDGTVAGIAHQTLPYFAVQFHPEAAPGPQDTEFLFDEFYEKIS